MSHPSVPPFCAYTMTTTMPRVYSVPCYVYLRGLLEVLRPNVVEQPELEQKDLNLMKLETDFPKEQFRLSPWPEGTVVFYQAHRFLNDCQWRYVDEDNCKLAARISLFPESPRPDT